MSLAAILGGAAGGFKELREIAHRVDAVYAVNDAAAQYPGALAEFVTLHPEHLSRWLGERRAAGLPEPGDIVAHSASEHVTEVDDYRWPGMDTSGSSGLFAAKRALLKHEHVVLCGVPMDAARGHFFNSAPWTDVEAFREAWRLALPHLVDRVRSMSGWTADLLGRPDFLWLDGGNPRPQRGGILKESL